MYRKLLTNTVLVNLTFLLVVVFGWISYLSMPREQDPDVNFNWVIINTLWPGATAEDVENQVTNPIEEEIEKVPDINRVSSSSRAGFSFITVRFADMSQEDFDSRLEELRRTVQNAVDDLPKDAKQPTIVKLSSSNTFPTAVVTVSGLADDTQLQKLAREVQKDLARLKGVDRVDPWGAADPELHVDFDPGKLVGLGISPVALAQTVNAYFRDLSAGSLQLGDQQWKVRLKGTSNDPKYLANLPVLSLQGELPLRSVSDITKGHEDPAQKVSFEGQPAVMLSVFKRSNANSLQLLEELRQYVKKKNPLLDNFGIHLDIVDDQTVSIRNAISKMENNAIIGLILVMVVTGIILGWKIAFFTALGLVFSLMGTFWILSAMGESLNIMVLLGVVIVLGMLVDDAVVIVESIYVNLKQGMQALEAAQKTIREMWVPVTVASLTTIAAFLPLILLPGILGQFMRVVPIVVSVALVVSLIEAFWLLPSHIVSSKVNPSELTTIQTQRNRIINWIRHRYVKALIPAMRYPKYTLGIGAGLMLLVMLALAANLVKVDFFANDPIRLFYLNLTMPPGTSLEATDDMLKKLDRKIRQSVDPKQYNSLSTVAGIMLTETEPVSGENIGQVMVSLPARKPGLKSVEELIEEVREAVSDVPGVEHISFLRRLTGPPSESPVSVKVRGDSIAELRQAAAELQRLMESIPGIRDIHNDDVKAGMQLEVKLDPDAITRAQLDPTEVAEVLRLYADGSIAAQMRHEGEKWNVRVRAKNDQVQDIHTYLEYPVGLRNGEEIALGQLVNHDVRKAEENIKHRNFRRTIAVEADIDSTVTDTLRANKQIEEKWQAVAEKYPGVSLDFSGEMDDIKESLAGMAALFLLGVGLIYLILGTQFKSYTQPLLILATVPMAFTGVIIGLIVSNEPLSLYTLYGVIALAGIAANDAIVLISTANNNLHKGMGLIHAITMASQRRIIPILITTVTTMAGLFSLAAGWGGKSLMWGPVATAIVWGLAVSTALTLFLIPPLYAYTMRNHKEEVMALVPPPPLPGQATGIRALIEKVKRLFNQEGSADEKDLQQIASNPALKEVYKKASQAFSEKNTEEAIRHFQALAKLLPNNFIVNLLAAESMVLMMQDIGWDIGYMNRARRHLKLAERLRPKDARTRHLQALMHELDQNKGENALE